VGHGLRDGVGKQSATDAWLADGRRSSLGVRPQGSEAELPFPTFCAKWVVRSDVTRQFQNKIPGLKTHDRLSIYYRSIFFSRSPTISGNMRRAGKSLGRGGCGGAVYRAWAFTWAGCKVG
jgi:hypothetical protein